MLFLVKLNKAGNLLSGSILITFTQLTGLTHLDLSNNLLNDNLPSDLSNMVDLVGLFLQKNTMSGTLLILQFPIFISSASGLDLYCTMIHLLRRQHVGENMIPRFPILPFGDSDCSMNLIADVGIKKTEKKRKGFKMST
ncbi:hypothetical protein L2E82_51176 [Cichorium intybus]|nr:hypothetical protein L2E82_51176 [Cichorium intybus]